MSLRGVSLREVMVGRWFWIFVSCITYLVAWLVLVYLVWSSILHIWLSCSSSFGFFLGMDLGIVPRKRVYFGCYEGYVVMTGWNAGVSRALVLKL